MPQATRRTYPTPTVPRRYTGATLQHKRKTYVCTDVLMYKENGGMKSKTLTAKGRKCAPDCFVSFFLFVHLSPAVVLGAARSAAAGPLKSPAAVTLVSSYPYRHAQYSGNRQGDQQRLHYLGVQHPPMNEQPPNYAKLLLPTRSANVHQ